ncbi:MAG: alanine--tRNA ligase [Alphaproteobacteria bacterium]|nr:MAG: alanine--tRNA ligase [Rickettsiaceae bacterium 4572_127]
MKLSEIREEYLKFYESKGHTRVASTPVTTGQADKSLLFMNSGMVAFKDIFLEKEHSPYKRITSAQKCIRIGGKHNDLENVGYTARHHTFFEMLGNFSFGDYFKEKAILYAWEFLSSVLKLQKEKLVITVHKDDSEARELWKKIAGFSDDRIINHPDNFWEMGKTGPCGTNTEIFYDLGENVSGGMPGTADEDGQRFLEIWNNVFMQNYRDEDGKISMLPNQNIDTGMGLERTASVMQGKLDSYDIDTFENIMEQISNLTGQKQTMKNRTSFKVIADHIRCLSFMIADGVLPSNEGRGYVLRRILRRAMRHANILGVKKPILHLLAPSVEEEMGEYYPELINANASIIQTIQTEEENFSKTLFTGLKILEDETAGLSKGSVFSGESAFKLYDTYGFPIDMTKDALRSKGLTLNEKEFEKAMKEQKDRSRKNKKFGTGTTTNAIWNDIKDREGETVFTGYSELKSEAKVVAIIQNGKEISSANLNETVEVIANTTPFYGEAGGQAGDIGRLNDNEILDTQKPISGLTTHTVRVDFPFKVGDKILLNVDFDRRKANIRAHSSAHLFQSALREILGSHCAQRGSSVKNDVMRFDFSHPKAVSNDELLKIEKFVNSAICENLEIKTENMPKEKALAEGVVALFGEKYGDTVRVVEMGNVSQELCGGTHVKRTGDIGFFKIISEGSLASGIRRIEAFTGQKAVEKIQKTETDYFEILAKLKSTPEKSTSRIESILEKNKYLSAQLGAFRKKALTVDLLEEKEVINDVIFVTKVLDLSTKELKPTVQGLMEKLKDSEFVICLISHFEDKVSAIVGVSENISKTNPAGSLVKIVSAELGGKGGGGTPALAQAGGTNINGAKKAFEILKKEI